MMNLDLVMIMMLRSRLMVVKTSSYRVIAPHI